MSIDNDKNTWFCHLQLRNIDFNKQSKTNPVFEFVRQFDIGKEENPYCDNIEISLPNLSVSGYWNFTWDYSYGIYSPRKDSNPDWANIIFNVKDDNPPFEWIKEASKKYPFLRFELAYASEKKSPASKFFIHGEEKIYPNHTSNNALYFEKEQCYYRTYMFLKRENERNNETRG